MTWIAGVLVLILFFVFPKKMFIVAGILLLSAGVFFGYLSFEEWQHRKAKELVSISIDYEPAECKQPYPLKVVITNMSDRTVLKVEWDIEVTKPGFSSDLADYGYHKYSQDKVLKHKDGWRICYSVPKLKDQVTDYSELKYSSKNKYVTFEQGA